MRDDAREGRSEANSEVIIEQEHTTTDREHNTLLSLLSTTDDVQRLQVLLVLMSIYHQSVYNGLTLTAQQAVFTDPQQQQGLQGYFLCNKVYARSVVHALCEVLKQETLRPVTAQCAVYVMKYLLANHIYDDVLPAEVLDEFATMWALSRRVRRRQTERELVRVQHPFSLQRQRLEKAVRAVRSCAELQGGGDDDG